MQFGTLVFTALATAATLIQAAALPEETFTLSYCTEMFKPLDPYMTPGQGEFPYGHMQCTLCWDDVVKLCDIDPPPSKVGEIPDGYEECVMGGWECDRQ